MLVASVAEPSARAADAVILCRSGTGYRAAVRPALRCRDGCRVGVEDGALQVQDGSSRPSWVSTVCLASVSWREMPWRRQAIWRLRQLWRAAGSCPRRRAGRRRSAGVESHCSRGAMTAAASGSTCWYRPGTAVEEGRSRHGAPSGAMRQLLPPGCRSAGLLRRPIVLELTSHFIDLKCADE